MATHTISLTIDAPAQKVFAALTQPELVKLWQFGRTVQSDWQPGHSIKFIAETEGKVLEQHGTILEMRTNELIKYNLFTAAPGVEDKKEHYTSPAIYLHQIMDKQRSSSSRKTTGHSVLVLLP